MALDDTDLNSMQRSWQTRMESVGRQLVRLAAMPVHDTKKDQMVHVAGLFIVPLPDETTMIRVNVVPTDKPGDMYSTDIQNLEA